MSFPPSSTGGAAAASAAIVVAAAGAGAVTGAATYSPPPPDSTALVPLTKGMAVGGGVLAGSLAVGVVGAGVAAFSPKYRQLGSFVALMGVGTPCLLAIVALALPAGAGEAPQPKVLPPSGSAQ